MDRILHVSESFGGGVKQAILTYAEATDEFEHHILANERRIAKINSTDFPHIESFTILEENAVLAMKQIKETVEEIEPKVLHAHSSYAGMFCRLLKATGLLSGVRVIYTPHGLAFNQQGFSQVKRSLIWIAEWILSHTSSDYIACSHSEAEILRRFPRPGDIFEAPNAVSPYSPFYSSEWRKPDIPAIGMVGRITDARNPEQFIEIYQALKKKIPEVMAIWVGHGDEEKQAALQAAGIEVTGWLSPKELIAAMQRMTLLVFTTKSEGFPFTLLEASAFGLPFIAAKIPELEEIPASHLFESVEQATACIQNLLTLSNTEIQHKDEEFERFLKQHRWENLQSALRSAYAE